MGLRGRAKQYKKEVKEKARFPLEFDVYNFVTELLSNNKPDLQIKTILLSFMNKFNVNKILINFLDEKENIYHLLGYKGIKEKDTPVFDFDYQDYFLKALIEPVKFSELIKEPKHKNELNQFITNDFKIIFPLHYKKELKGFITLGNKMDGSEYTTGDIEQIKQISQLIAASLYNTHSFQDTYNKLEELEKDQKMYLNLFEGIKNINLAENLDEAVTIFFRTIKDSHNIQTANIMIKDKETKGYKTLKSLGLTKETDDNFKIQGNEITFNNIMELGESMFISDFEELEIYKNAISEVDKEKIKTFYTVPIKLGNTGFGFINIFDLGDNFTGELSRIQERIISFLPFGLLPYIINENK